MYMLECVHLKKSYKDKIILNNVNYKFPTKGMVLICGSSGCGKTTLLNLLEGLDKRYEGTILFNGLDISKKKNNQELQRNSYLIFQECNFIDFLSVEENVSLIVNIKHLDYHISKIKFLLERYGMGFIMSENIQNLSGGQKQILSLVLSYVSEAKIIFCDEPTGSMDENSEKISLQLLNEIANRKLVIIVSHNVKLFKSVAYKTLCLEGGNLVC